MIYVWSSLLNNDEYKYKSTVGVAIYKTHRIVETLQTHFIAIGFVFNIIEFTRNGATSDMPDPFKSKSILEKYIEKHKSFLKTAVSRKYNRVLIDQ